MLPNYDMSKMAMNYSFCLWTNFDLKFVKRNVNVCFIVFFLNEEKVSKCNFLFLLCNRKMPPFSSSSLLPLSLDRLIYTFPVYLVKKFNNYFIKTLKDDIL